MLSQAQVARDWVTSREYVRQCVKKGCPLTSFEDARLWRDAHARKRPPTSPIQLNQQLAEEKDDDSPEARQRRKEYFANKAEGVKLSIPTGNSLDDALANAVRASEEAFRLLEEAMIEGKDAKIGVRLSIHNRATEQRFKAEQAHREEQERRRILIPLAEAEDMARRGYDIILSRLLSMPQNISPRVNPHDPHHAMEILQTECAGIIEDAQKSFMKVA